MMPVGRPGYTDQPGYNREQYVAAVREAIGSQSQRSIAVEIGCNQSYVHDWLKGRVPDRRYLLKLAEVTGTEPNKLLAPAGMELVQPDTDRQLNEGLLAISEEFGIDVQLSTEDIKIVRANPEQMDAVLQAIRDRARKKAKRK